MAEAESDEFLFSLQGRVRNLGFSPSPLNALFPLFEAIANAFHAIEARFDRDAPKKGVIQIDVIRSDSEDESPPVIGFIVKDNGVGLDQDNWKAFRTADTDSKIKRGGKGVGRLSWLKVFQNTQIVSIFDDAGTKQSRVFEFGLSEESRNPIKNHSLTTVRDDAELGTRVHLEPFEDDYLSHCPRKTFTIATQIIGHFLKHFVSYEVPRFVLNDAGSTINLLDFFSENVESEEKKTISVNLGDLIGNIEIDIYNILLKKSIKFHDSGKHWLVFVGDGRVVRQERVDNQLGLNYIGNDQDAVYIGLVASDYQDKHVTQERTKFTFPEDTFKAIYQAAIQSSKDYLSDEINKVREKQAKTTLSVVRENPQFLSIVHDVPAFVS